MEIFKNFSFFRRRGAARRYQKERRERKGKEIDSSNAKMTFGQAATLHLKRLAENVSIKRRTRNDWRETLDALLKDWPKLADTEIRHITPTACWEWAARYAKIACAPRYSNISSS